MEEKLKVTILPATPDLKTADGVKEFMARSKSESEWNSKCDQIKAANEGQYPEFWYQTVVISGLMSETSAKFAKK